MKLTIESGSPHTQILRCAQDDRQTALTVYIISVVRKYEFEPGQLDYKSILVSPRSDPAKDENNASIRRTVCSMANADGGVILFVTTRQCGVACCILL